MKFVNQLDYPDWLYVTKTDLEEERREHGRTTTVATYACGLCSAVIVADRLLVNSNFELKDALALAYETKANYHVGTSYKRFAPAFADKLGLEWEPTRDPERLLYCLRTGGAAVVLVDGDREDRVGVFSHTGHYIVAISEERDGRIVILDPAYKEGKYEEEGRRGLVEVKNSVMAICDLQTLVKDSADISIRFHLFWRK